MFTKSEIVRMKTIEVIDATPFAADLFKRSFHQPIPDFPKHFVLIAYTESGKTLTLGYVHFTLQEQIYLGGGMCVNTTALRSLPKTLRKQLSSTGGVAYTMLSESVKLLTNCIAVFGHVGHPGAYKIDLSVGFEQTKHPHLIVYWKQKTNPSQQAKLIQQAFDFGPFLNINSTQ